MLTVYRSIALTSKNFRTYLENYDLKNLKVQIDIQENEQRGAIFKPLSDNFIIIRCGSNLRFQHCTHLIYDFDNKTRLGIRASTSEGENQIDIIPEHVEDFTIELSSKGFIDTLLPDETGGKICFWGSKLGVISTLNAIDFSVKWKGYREYQQKWFKDYFPVGGLSDNFDNSLILFTHICLYDKTFLLQLSNYKINLVFKGLANLNKIRKAFDSIEPHRLPKNSIKTAEEQKKFIDDHESLIFETENSLQNIYLFLNTLKVASKDNIFITILKKIGGSWLTSKLTDEADQHIEQAVVWMQSLNLQ